MTGYQKPPPEPTGGEADAVYLRRLYNWLRDMRLLDVKGARQVPEPTGGFHLIIDPPKYPATIAPPQRIGFYPFKLYQPTNINDFLGQMIQMVPEATFGVTGTLVPCKVVPANPDGTSSTNLAANPPLICVTDTWRFWAVRWGYVEIRPNYPLPGNILPTLAGNFASQVIPTYCDQSFETLPSVPPDSDITDEATSIIALGTNPDQVGFISASFWIEVQQDTSNPQSAGEPTAIIRGWAFQPNISLHTPAFMSFGTYGNGDIPVGCINGFPNNGGVTAYNFRFDHALNRYPCGNGNYPASKGNGTALNIRGSVKWDSAAGHGVCTPADIATQLFYPGDAIYYYQYDSTAHTIAFLNQFVFTATFPGLIAATFADGKTPNLGTDANWTPSFPVNLQSNPAP